MAKRIFAGKGFAWSSRLALLLGVGALSATAAEATPSDRGKNPVLQSRSGGELRIWTEGGRIYLAEAGTAARELQFGDTAEAHRLSTLLRRSGGAAGGIDLDRIILAGGGGCGFDFSPPRPTADSSRQMSLPAPSSAYRQPGSESRPMPPISSTASRHTTNNRDADRD